MRCWIRGLRMWVFSTSPTHTHTHTVAPQVCALSGGWQVVNWGFSKWRDFASTALMPQTKYSIQEGFREQAWGWRSDCLPDWLRPGCRAWIFVSVPLSASAASFLPFGQYAREYVAFNAYHQSLIITVHSLLWIIPNMPKTIPLEAARRITWWLVFSLW